MKKLNKSLFSILAILLIISCIGSIFAYSDEGSGSIDLVEDDDDDSNSNIVVSDKSTDDSTDDSSDDSSNDVSVSLTKHATGNPLILLLGALTLVGYSTRHFK